MCLLTCTHSCGKHFWIPKELRGRYAKGKEEGEQPKKGTGKEPFAARKNHGKNEIPQRRRTQRSTKGVRIGPKLPAYRGNAYLSDSEL